MYAYAFSGGFGPGFDFQDELDADTADKSAHPQVQDSDASTAWKPSTGGYQDSSTLLQQRAMTKKTSDVIRRGQSGSVADTSGESKAAQAQAQALTEDAVTEDPDDFWDDGGGGGEDLLLEEKTDDDVWYKNPLYIGLGVLALAAVGYGVYKATR